MDCNACGFNCDDCANFCPNCGKKVEDREKSKKLASPPEVAKWLKIVFAVILAALAILISVILFSPDMTDVVSDQLQAIKKKNIEEAYKNYTSQAFQAATPLEGFREFAQTYPAFAHYHSVRYINRHVNSNDTGSLHAMVLTDGGAEIPLLYRLIKENGDWKIASIQLGDSHEGLKKSDEVFDSSPLQAAIAGMMEFIKNKHLKEAYQDYTSEDFRKETSMKDFETFIHENPAFLSMRQVVLEKLSFDNNMAILFGKLIDEKENDYPIQYYLVQENGTWKALHVQVAKN